MQTSHRGERPMIDATRPGRNGRRPGDYGPDLARDPRMDRRAPFLDGMPPRGRGTRRDPATRCRRPAAAGPIGRDRSSRRSSPTRRTSAVADALNRVADGRDLRPGQRVGDASPDRPERRIARRPDGAQSSLRACHALDPREGEWMAELRQAFERSDAQVGADEVPAAPRRSRMRLDPPLACVFTASSRRSRRRSVR